MSFLHSNGRSFELEISTNARHNVHQGECLQAFKHLGAALMQGKLQAMRRICKAGSLMCKQQCEEYTVHVYTLSDNASVEQCYNRQQQRKRKETAGVPPVISNMHCLLRQNSQLLTCCLKYNGIWLFHSNFSTDHNCVKKLIKPKTL